MELDFRKSNNLILYLSDYDEKIIFIMGVIMKCVNKRFKELLYSQKYWVIIYTNRIIVFLFLNVFINS